MVSSMSSAFTISRGENLTAKEKLEGEEYTENNTYLSNPYLCNSRDTIHGSKDTHSHFLDSSCM